MKKTKSTVYEGLAHVDTMKSVVPSVVAGIIEATLITTGVFYNVI